ncbi:hypothetical protein LX32DRAFT_633951 [Colletotrichum zoysiae]|uniref:Uncharacterized protein n=1 Tax=Colletotrichum zoysiae TaxID=1216348 RepID=A0AAD9M664_9PEZI|nr:hypothetical protein LX32DRAFT_633951 [Colletotrichum zoysiae]
MTDEVGNPIREPLQLVIDGPPPPYTKDCSRWLSSDSPGRASAAFSSSPYLNGYRGETPSGMSYYDLGAARDEKRFRVCARCIPAKRTEALHIHNGLDSEDDILATITRSVKETSYNGEGQDTFNFTLHAIEGFGNVGEQVKMYRLCDSKWGHRNTLELVVDTGGRSERFQWRPSKGKEVRGLAGYSSGWKLVRMTSREAGVGGRRMSREEGFTSDGREVVAVIAHTLSLRKDFVFAVLGSGRSGALGSAWETAALLSGIWIWWNSVNGSMD